MDRVDVPLEEYKALRAESIAHQQAQTTLVSVALTATAAIGALAFGAKAPEEQRIEILLVLPIVLCGLALAHLNHTYMALRVGEYVRDHLWPPLQEAARAAPGGVKPIPSWEDEVRKGRTFAIVRGPRGWLGWLPGALIFGVPSLASLIITENSRPTTLGGEGGDLEVAWCAGAVSVVCAVIFTVLVGLAGKVESDRLRAARAWIRTKVFRRAVAPPDPMRSKISFDGLPGQNTKNFQGCDHGASTSFYLAVNEPGTGPSLHRHPYDETFIVQEGTVTFTVEGKQLDASAGEIVVVPARAAHKFENTGEGTLRQVNIHPQDHMVQEDLE